MSVSKILYEFVNKDLLPKSGVSKQRFWKGFNQVVHKLSPINKKLIETREKIQKSIDSYHLENKDKKFNKKNYKEFLEKIGYLKKRGVQISKFKLVMLMKKFLKYVDHN